MIKYNQYIEKYNKIFEEESSPRIPNSESYWINKGKKGKIVALYTHDDLDGIFSAIEIKKYLLRNGFKIEKYGILNYSEGWKFTKLDPKLINVVVDFASMPGGISDTYIDYYVDHHGLFSEDEILKYKNYPVQKINTGSAYEAICLSLGIRMDALTVSVIDMVDSAKYKDYGVEWTRLLDFNLSDIKVSKNRRLEFSAAFNQFIKRSDTKTLISVIDNCSDASVYSIYNAMKALYPSHNIDKFNREKDFIKDSKWRIGEMSKRTLGAREKKVFMNQEEFLKQFQKDGVLKLDGYQIIGDLAFVPSGTWANALRIRSLLVDEVSGGIIPNAPKFILLQYGGTLQVCSYESMSDYKEFPRTKKGEVIDNLGVYMSNLLENFKKHLGYHDPNTSIGQDEITVSGGHKGIGSISNIFGVCDVGSYVGCKFIDMFKNKIINDLSGVSFDLKIKWSNVAEYTSKSPEMEHRVIRKGDVTKLNKFGKVFIFKEYSFSDLQGSPTFKNFNNDSFKLLSRHFPNRSSSYGGFNRFYIDETKTKISILNKLGSNVKAYRELINKTILHLLYEGVVKDQLECDPTTSSGYEYIIDYLMKDKYFFIKLVPELKSIIEETTRIGDIAEEGSVQALKNIFGDEIEIENTSELGSKTDAILGIDSIMIKDGNRYNLQIKNARGRGVTKNGQYYQIEYLNPKIYKNIDYFVFKSNRNYYVFSGKDGDGNVTTEVVKDGYTGYRISSNYLIGIYLD
jgi:hypothetical protein